MKLSLFSELVTNTNQALNQSKSSNQSSVDRAPSGPCSFDLLTSTQSSSELELPIDDTKGYYSLIIRFA